MELDIPQIGNRISKSAAQYFAVPIGASGRGALRQINVYVTALLLRRQSGCSSVRRCTYINSKLPS